MNIKREKLHTPSIESARKDEKENKYTNTNNESYVLLLLRERGKEEGKEGK